MSRQVLSLGHHIHTSGYIMESHMLCVTLTNNWIANWFGFAWPDPRREFRVMRIIGIECFVFTQGTPSRD